MLIAVKYTSIIYIKYYQASYGRIGELECACAKQNILYFSFLSLYMHKVLRQPTQGLNAKCGVLLNPVTTILHTLNKYFIL
jgi:hypothetical protein